MSTQGLYVYAIVPADAENLDLGTGINDAPIQLVNVPGGLAAVVHEHGTEPYQGPDSEVERWIIEHSETVDRAWEAAGTALPVSFNVIVSPGDNETSEARLSDWLADHAPALQQHLERLRGRVELRVEIALDEEAVAANSEEIVAMRDETQQRPAGVQRLYRKRLQEREREVTERLADGLYPEYRRRLAALSEGLVENQRPGRDPGKVSVLTVSLLVPEDGVDQVGVELASIRDSRPGVQIRYLGPWPPYSFAEIPEMGSTSAKATTG